MKKLSVALWASLLMIVLFSCKKDDVKDPQDPENPIPVGKVTPVGTPDNSPAVSKTIGTAGGSLTSQDGRLKIVIPAGALTADQQVSIQSIGNNNPLGLQQAYRIQPHNVQFSKPVSVQFTYADEDIAQTIPEALGIAYQDEKGIWQARGGMVLDKNNKTVTATTTHFSDWSLFESFFLMVSQPVVSVNGSTGLEVFTTDELIIPLTPEKEVPIGEKKAMALKYIKEWKLAGAGDLTPNAATATAIYKAPATIPSTNPVAVSVKLDLKERGLYLLVASIEITNDDGEIEIRVAGNGWVKKTASAATDFGGGLYGIADSDGDVQGSYVLIMWEGGVGTHPFKSPEVNKGTYAHYLVTGVNSYVCSYVKDDKLIRSGGGVTITSMGEDDGFIKGTFTIEPAGYGDDLKQTIGVEGKFRVKRYW